MFKKRILQALACAILIPSAFAVLPASAQDPAPHSDARFRQLGDCMAFFAVAGGLDGKKDVDPNLAQKIADMGTELMFEASILGYDDDKAQTYVVNRLVERNTEVNENGSDEMIANYGPMCTALSDQVSGKEKPKG